MAGMVQLSSKHKEYFIMSQVTENTTTADISSTREPSKKSRANAIFAAKLTERAQGLYGSNKEFRSSVLNAIIQELGVSMASAATMYNTAKADAEEQDPDVNLGRDPKKAKPVSTGRRGRPAGSTNKKKEESSPVSIEVVEEQETV